MNLKKLSNQDLNQTLKSLVQKERELLTEILWHIREVDRRELHLAMGYASLFAYLTEYLGYSAASSQRRIDAARLLIELPEVSEMIESGKINLSQVSMLQQSAREAKRVHQHKVATQIKKEILLQIQDKTKAETQSLVSKALELPILEKPITKHQADESVRVEMTFTKQQWQKIQQMQQILSNSVNSQDLSAAMNYLAEKVIQKKYGKAKPDLNNADSKAKVAIKGNILISGHNLKSSGQLKTNPNEQPVNIQNSTNVHDSTSAAEVATGKTSHPRKYISINLKRQIFLKHPSCQYRNPQTGKICGQKHFLQIEHIKPIWAGGTGEPQNLTTLCANHNRYLYKKQSGLQRVL